jgi:dihydrofolate reductase
LASSLSNALTRLLGLCSEIFVIGGHSLYKEALLSPNLKHCFITEIFDHQELPADVWFPENHLKEWPICENITDLAYEWLVSRNNVKPKKCVNRVDYIDQEVIKYRFLHYSK